MAGDKQHFGVVVGVDGSPSSHVAVQWAAHEAVLHKLPLTLVHAIVAPAPIWASASMRAEYRRSHEVTARAIVNDAISVALGTVTNAEPPEIDSRFYFCAPAPTLVNMSKHAEMVVVGARGLGLARRMLLGSVSTGLIHQAHCPVSVIHHQDSTQSRASHAPVLLGINGSPASEVATTIAFEEASLRGTELLALHAWSDADMSHITWIEWSARQTAAEQALAAQLASWQERFPDVSIHRVAVYANPAIHLLTRAESAQLVVVGSRGRGGFAGMLLGSVSNAVAHAVRTPVIVVRSDGRRSGGGHG